MKTPQQSRIIRLEYDLNQEFGYTLKTTSVPDKENYGDTIWTIEAVNRLDNHKFVSKPCSTLVYGLGGVYLEALEHLYKQVDTFRKRKGE
jgi:hypothetical protein